MEWSKAPETVLKIGDFAPYEGVLVPPLNYKNYKTFERIKPEFDRLMDTADLPMCNEPGVLGSHVFWGVIGVLVGGAGMAWALK